MLWKGKRTENINNEREREREREYVVCLSFVLFVHCTYFKVALLFGV